MVHVYMVYAAQLLLKAYITGIAGSCAFWHSLRAWVIPCSKRKVERMIRVSHFPLKCGRDFFFAAVKFIHSPNCEVLADVQIQ